MFRRHPLVTYFCASLTLVALYNILIFMHPSQRIGILIGQLLRPSSAPYPTAASPSTAMVSPVSTTLPPPQSVLDFWLAPPPDDQNSGSEALFNKWFRGPASLDDHIRQHFRTLVEAARTEPPTLPPSWKSCLSEVYGRGEASSSSSHPSDDDDAPHTTLALLILLDQFPRNIYRGSGLSFASDARAQKVAQHAVSKGLDKQVPLIQRLFFYLPFMHAEDLELQRRGVELMEGWVSACEKGGKPTAAGESADGTGGGEDGKGGGVFGDEAMAAGKALGYGTGHLRTIQVFGRFPARNAALGRECTDEERVFLEGNPAGLFMS